MPKVQMTTLGYIETRESYLMLHRVKKEQDVNEGKWIGIGGKFEYGESPEECMIREAKEETGLAVTSMKFRGILTFICDKQDPEYICLYTIDGFSGQLKECDEGELLWVPKDEIFGLNLWEGDRIFFRSASEGCSLFLSETLLRRRSASGSCFKWRKRTCENSESVI